MNERYWSDLVGPGVPQHDFAGFARYVGFPYFFRTPRRTTLVGGLETYRQMHALYTGALPSEVL